MEDTVERDYSSNVTQAKPMKAPISNFLARPPDRNLIFYDVVKERGEFVRASQLFSQKARV